MRILFLDDMESRHRAIPGFCNGAHIDHAHTAEEAIGLLDANVYDIASLDHDLVGVFTASDATSGAEVARHIAKMEPNRWPRRIIVHSWNPEGAQRMLEILAGKAEAKRFGSYLYA